MKGKDLYNEILKKYKSAITEKWEVDKYNSEDLGLMYYVLSNSKKKLTDKIGYAYYDINHDGIDELLIGEIKRFPLKGYIYDIYTMVDRNPVHALSADTQERYFICNNYFICIEYLSNNKENCTAVYFLEKNSTNISPQIKFIHDPAKNKKTPGFIVYGNSKNPENVTKRIFKEKKDSFCKYNKINLTPLSKFKY